MMYYRRKVLLSILEIFQGKMSAKMLQKYLFLMAQLQTAPSFDFVPYHYGSYSFQAAQDIATLSKYGYLSVSSEVHAEKFIHLCKSEGYLGLLDKTDRHILSKLYSEFGNFSQNELLRYVYLAFPEYAVNSKIAAQLLSPTELVAIEKKRPQRLTHTPFLCTLGYEGISLEDYLKKLIAQDIHIVCDVRKNAYSQKFGFSKSPLKNACDGLGIRYVHLPILGIPASNREKLQTRDDYDALFRQYEETILRGNPGLEIISQFLKTGKRVVLACFEADADYCHRSRIFNTLAKTLSDSANFQRII